MAALPAGKQVEAVAARLKERNPGFDGKVTHEVELGVVIELRFLAVKVTDLSPVRGLKGLTSLTCNASSRKGILADLTPLKDMKLTYLNCSNTQVSDLTPLKDMKLSQLHCGATQVSDLTALKDLKLTFLDCSGTRVSDLTPLKEMKLTALSFPKTLVRDLSPLRGMPLKSIRCDLQTERDLEILRSIKTLKTINYNSAKQFWQEVNAKKLEKRP